MANEEIEKALNTMRKWITYIEADPNPDEETLECLELLRAQVKMMEAAQTSGEPIYFARAAGPTNK